jgi:hypothetical protein
VGHLTSTGRDEKFAQNSDQITSSEILKKYDGTTWPGFMSVQGPVVRCCEYGGS